MSVAGYALSAYRVEQPDVLQGSLNFAISIASVPSPC
jgi:hypothetical protein